MFYFFFLKYKKKNDVTDKLTNFFFSIFKMLIKKDKWMTNYWQLTG